MKARLDRGDRDRRAEFRSRHRPERDADTHRDEPDHEHAPPRRADRRHRRAPTAPPLREHGPHRGEHRVLQRLASEPDGAEQRGPLPQRMRELAVRIRDARHLRAQPARASDREREREDRERRPRGARRALRRERNRRVVEAAQRRDREPAKPRDMAQGPRERADVQRADPVAREHRPRIPDTDREPRSEPEHDEELRAREPRGRRRRQQQRRDRDDAHARQPFLLRHRVRHAHVAPHE